MEQKEKKHTAIVSAPDGLTGLVHITDGEGGFCDVSQDYVSTCVYAHLHLVEALRECIGKENYWHGKECLAKDPKLNCDCWVSKAKQALEKAGA